MFGEFTYLGYTLIFTTPLLVFLWWRHFGLLRAQWRLIGAVTLLAVVCGFFVWPLGPEWGCWAYAQEKILGIGILGVVLEDLVWWALVVFLLASFVVVSADLEDADRPIIRGMLFCAE